MADEYIPLERVRLKITAVWLTGALFTSMLLILQTVFGKYGNRAQDVWSWALPTILPTLSLIMSVLGADALKKRRPVQVSLGFYRIAISLSGAYLLLVLFTILIEPVTPYEPLEWLKLSNLWLGPSQGLVASSVGVLFFSKK
jgi:hypothetical protein